MTTWRIEQASALALPFDDGSVHCCVTSPPYWGLRDYGHDDQIGLESTPEAYVENMVRVFREVRRVLRDDATLWLNLGDSYAAQGGAHNGRSDNQNGVGAKSVHLAGGGDRGVRVAPSGLKPKDLVGIPWRVAFALQADGWYLRSDIIWAKPNPMPESVTDRPTKAHEYVFLLSKSQRYYYDADAVREVALNEGRIVKATDPTTAKNGQKGRFGATAAGFTKHDTVVSGRNKRTVWTVTTQPYPGAHFAVFPPKLIEPCVLAGCPEDGTVLDPFTGSGTTGAVALTHGRSFVGTEINPEYVALAEQRLARALADSGRATPDNLPEGVVAQLGLFGGDT